LKALKKFGKGKVELVEVPTPDLRSTDLLLKPLYSGICATDLHVLYHDLGQNKEERFPVVMGHEFSAEVVEKGDMVSNYIGSDQNISIGDRVTVEPVLPCGKCDYCLKGHINVCPHMSHLGMYEDGCYADFVRVPFDRVHKLPDGLTSRAGALVEPLSCAINFIDKSQIQPGNTVVILGGGSIGILTLQVALAAGAGQVIVSEPVQRKRELALKLGASEVIDPINENIYDKVKELTDHKGADIVIECVGIPATASQMLHLVRKGGRCVMSGIPAESVDMDLSPLVFGEVELVGVHATAWQFPRAMRLIERGLVDVEASLDRTVPFSEAIEALELCYKSNEVGKMVIEHGK
jgi:2-desacetyl-2-hydroxyethyl bacteriochlorophyllide A dehydrogenase